MKIERKKREKDISNKRQREKLKEINIEKRDSTNVLFSITVRAMSHEIRPVATLYPPPHIYVFRLIQ